MAEQTMINLQAPAFELEASNGQKIRLDDMRGSYVVLIFYPMNDTPICNRQLDAMNVNLDAFINSNCRVFGVNTASKEKQRSYCERRRLQFPILSDAGAFVAKQYGTFNKYFPFAQKRTVVAIDPDGTICFYERGNPEPDKVLDIIRSRATQAP